MPSSSPTEAETRRTLIDKALLRAGWNPSDRSAVGQEIPVDGFSPMAWQELERKIRESGLPPNTLYILDSLHAVDELIETLNTLWAHHH